MTRGDLVQIMDALLCFTDEAKIQIIDSEGQPRSINELCYFFNKEADCFQLAFIPEGTIMSAENYETSVTIWPRNGLAALKVNS